MFYELIIRKKDHFYTTPFVRSKFYHIFLINLKKYAKNIL
jgi:hypothetical protein